MVNMLTSMHPPEPVALMKALTLTMLCLVIITIDFRALDLLFIVFPTIFINTCVSTKEIAFVIMFYELAFTISLYSLLHKIPKNASGL